MAKKSLKNEGRDYAVQVFGCAAVFYSASAGIAYYGDGYFDLVWPALAAVSAPVILRVLDSPRLKSRQTSFAFGSTAARSSYRVNNRPGLFQSLVKWSDGGYDPDPNPANPNGYNIRYDTPERDIFWWDVQLANRYEPVTIFEDNLLDFVREVSKRQRRGERYPLSRPYFTQRRRPAIGEPDYRAMVEILNACGQITNRSQGASGRLRNLVPYGVVWYAKQTFTALSH